MKKSISYLLVFFLLVLSSCSDQVQNNNDQHVKNIVFLIGDGMGIAQVYATMLNSDLELNMEKCKHTGLCTTFSLTNQITESSASGTALATGHKTRNGIIGQDTLGNDYKTILEIAEENGLATGLVATACITHATPASFIAHVGNRGNYEEIATDFLKTDIDIFIGGGYDHFANRSDSLDYTDSLKNKGYEIIRTMDQLKSSSANKIAALLYPVHPPKYSDGRNDMLPKATAKALEVLSKNEKGFFLMVEGSQIDWAGHANDGEFVVNETLDFDRALGVVLDFIKTHPNTLVVVTADHETGGLTLPSIKNDYSKVDMKFSTGGHTSVMVPVYAFGAGAENFTGMMDNTDFFPKFLKLYGFNAE